MGTPSAFLQHSTGIRPTALPGAGATFLGHRAAGQRLPSPGGVPQHPLLPPLRKVAAGKGPMFSSRSHIHSSRAHTKAQAAASRAQNTPNPTHLQHRAAALPQGISPLCNRSAGQQGLGQLLFPWLSLRMHHHWKGDGLRSVWCPVQLVLAAAPPVGGGFHLCWVSPGGSLSSWRRAGVARQPSIWKEDSEGRTYVMHRTGDHPGIGSPSPAPHLVVEGNVRGF